jgi:Right handed beta helix region
LQLNTLMSRRTALTIAFVVLATTVLLAGNPLTGEPAAAATTKLTFLPAADSYVSSTYPRRNYGTARTLQADASPIMRTYVTFDIKGVSGTIQSAQLRVFALTGSTTGYDLQSVADSSWQEKSITYANAPGLGPILASSLPFKIGSWVSFDVTPFIAGNGKWSVALTTRAKSVLRISSREQRAYAPQLVVEAAPTVPTPTPTSVPAQTETLSVSPLPPTSTPTLDPPTSTPTNSTVPTATSTLTKTPAPTATATATKAATVTLSPTPTSSSTPTPAAGGNVYYVSTSGDDSNPGTQARPWATIQKGANSATAGDLVYMRGGTYYPAHRIIPANSGSAAGGYITFAAYPGEKVVIDGSSIPSAELSNWFGIFTVSTNNYPRAYIKIHEVTFSHSAYAGIFVESADHVIIEDSATDLTGSSGIRVSSSNNIVISGNNLARSGYAGAYVETTNHLVVEKNSTDLTSSSGLQITRSSNVLVDGNKVRRADSGGDAENITISGGTSYFEVRNNEVYEPAGKEGIDIKGGASHGDVHHNYIHDFNDVTLYIDAYDKDEHDIAVHDNYINCNDGGVGITLSAEKAVGVLDDVRVYNNIVRNCTAESGIYLTSWSDGDPAGSGWKKNILIANNTVSGNGSSTSHGGIYIKSGNVQNVRVINNIVSQNSRWQIAVAPESASQTVVDHNLIDGYRGSQYETKGTNYVEASPLFVNPSTGDLRLQPGSPAIDRGTSLSEVANDYDGTSRPQGPAYDIGAYEYTSALQP